MQRKLTSLAQRDKTLQIHGLKKIALLFRSRRHFGEKLEPLLSRNKKPYALNKVKEMLFHQGANLADQKQKPL